MIGPEEARIAALVALSYVLGSVPSGVIVTRPMGIDLRKVGSGNIGATNVLRAAGRGAAALTLLGDMLKGALAVLLGRWLGLESMHIGLMGLAAVVGHDFSVFLRFRGGKGVATSLGAVLCYMPAPGLAAMVIWLTVVGMTRYSSLGALVAFAAVPAISAALGNGWDKLVISAIITVLLLYKHMSNIRNLINGSERRVGEKA